MKMRWNTKKIAYLCVRNAEYGNSRTIPGGRRNPLPHPPRNHSRQPYPHPSNPAGTSYPPAGFFYSTRPNEKSSLSKIESNRFPFRRRVAKPWSALLLSYSSTRLKFYTSTRLKPSESARTKCIMFQVSGFPCYRTDVFSQI